MSDALEDAFAARAAGVEANIAANQGGHRNHADRVERALAALVRSGREFTSMDLEALVLADGEGDFPALLLGSFIGVWSRLGRIVRLTDRPPVRAMKRSRHGSFIWVWRGADSNQGAA